MARVYDSNSSQSTRWCVYSQTGFMYRLTTNLDTYRITLLRDPPSISTWCLPHWVSETSRRPYIRQLMNTYTQKKFPPSGAESLLAIPLAVIYYVIYRITNLWNSFHYACTWALGKEIRIVPILWGHANDLLEMKFRYNNTLPHRFYPPP